MTDEAMARLARLDPEYVGVACDALLARLKRVHQAVSDSPNNEPLRRSAQAAHVANAEALLNMLSVLREDGTLVERERVLRAALDVLLARVGREFPWP